MPACLRGGTSKEIKKKLVFWYDRINFSGSQPEHLVTSAAILARLLFRFDMGSK
jgi:hypothetical protein